MMLMTGGSFLRSLVASSAKSSSGVVSLFNVRCMSSAAGGKFLVEEEKYAFLKELGLGKVNDGVYNGKWFGSGEVGK